MYIQKVENYIKNTDLENIVDKLAYNYSKLKSTRLKYKEIFNFIYYTNIINKKLNNQFGFAEIPCSFFKNISNRHYKKILTHMYDNQLIFTNVSMHKSSCGKNINTGLPIIRSFKIDRSLEHHINLNSGNLLNKNSNILEVNSLKKLINKELKQKNKIKAIKPLNKKYYNLNDLNDLISLINKNNKFAKIFFSRLIYIYNNIKNINFSLDYINLSNSNKLYNNFYFRILIFNNNELKNQIKKYQQNINIPFNINVDHCFYYLKNLSLEFFNKNYYYISSLYNNYYIYDNNNCALLSMDDYINHKVNYYQNIMYENVIYKVTENFGNKKYYTKSNIEDIEKLILKRYNYLDIDIDKIPYSKNDPAYKRLSSIWNKHSKARKSGNRIYSWFHQLKAEQRNFITLNGSHLVEAFDIPACNFCLLAKIFQKYDIEQNELIKFQNTVKNKYIYQEIAKFGGYQLSSIKRKLKSSTQHWLNIRKRNINRGHIKDEYFSLIDNYFKAEFPKIRELIVNYREVKHNNKISKAIWMDFQQLEYQLITKKICTRLTKDYHVLAVTVHDAVYIPQDQLRYIDINLSNLFWQELNLKYI